MIKKIILIFAICFALPVFTDFSCVSAENVNQSGEFEIESPEFEDPTSQQTEFAKPSKDYAQIYNNLEVPSFTYMHDIDPDQYFDIKDTAWSPYPLLRLNSYIYFKNIAIEPGYYLLTPREYKGNWYLLFKQNGKVAHIIPVYDRKIVAEDFYETHLPKPKLTFAQKVHMGALSFLGKFSSTKRRDPVKSYMEINDLENYFVSIVIYYGNHKYHTIFRTIRL